MSVAKYVAIVLIPYNSNLIFFCNPSKSFDNSVIDKNNVNTGCCKYKNNTKLTNLLLLYEKSALNQWVINSRLTASLSRMFNVGSV